MLKISAVMAIVAGLAMAGVKVALGEDLWWPFAVIEYIAGTLLILGALIALNRRQGALLACAWGLTAGLSWSMLFHHLQVQGAPSVLEFGLGVLLLSAVAGVLLIVGRGLRFSARGDVGAIAASVIAVLLAVTAQTPAAAQSPGLVGRWASQGFGSIVDFQPCQVDAAAMCGRIRWLWEANDSNGRTRVDGRNPDRSLRTRSLVGIEIIRGFRETAPGVWTGGSLYNPDDGRTYTGTIRLRQGALHLQGCALNVFCQTQVWRRPEDLIAAAQGS